MPADVSPDRAQGSASGSGLSPSLGEVRRIEVVINSASGGVDAGAAEALEAMLQARDLDANVVDARPEEVAEALRKAVSARPDLLIVLAGDGTARLACELAGAAGVPVAPLPGGTMNMLPYALFGRRPWREALSELLDRGEIKAVSGGEVGGHVFFCGALLGAPAMWQPAREALRKGKIRRAWRRAHFALQRAFLRRVRFRIDGGKERKARAISVMCPLVSRAMADDRALDVAVLDPAGAGEAIRLGVRTVLADLLGDWRQDPAVDAAPAHAVRLVSRHRAPALLDGERQRIPPGSTIRYRPAAFDAVFLPEVDPHEAAAGDRRKAELGAAVGAAAGEAATG